jgi:hypothetical protein
MANKNFKVRVGLEAPLIAADDGTTAITISNTSGNIALAGTLDVQGGTITDSTGALQITSGATNTNITLAPNGTGDVILTLANGGNLTNSRNYVFGAIRNSTTEGIGDIWAVNASTTVQPLRGISIDNSADTTKLPGLVLRTYNATGTNRGRVVLERARGTAASPTAVQSGDFLGEISVSGYSSTGWVNDTVSTSTGFFGFTASEAWVSNTALGTNFSLSLAPQTTTISSAANLVACLAIRPESAVLKGDQFAISRAKTSAFVATGCSTSGSVLTIGTVTSGTPAIGQVVQTSTISFLNSTYIVSNVSGSGSGSVWNVSSTPGTQSSLTVTGQTGFIGSPAAATTVDALSDLRLLSNIIKGSGGTTQITTSSAGATLALAGDTITLENAAGTDYAVFSNSNILNNRATRNAITTATVTEGSTYTPATTDNNSISLTINTGSGTTIIDLINLTGQGTGGMYTIMVHNNAATGTPIQVRNTRIGAGNLTSHTIPAGERIMITAYIVGDYATSEHLVVA